MKGVMVSGVQAQIPMTRIILVTVVRMKKDMTVAVINVVMFWLVKNVVMTLLLNHHITLKNTKRNAVVQTRFVVREFLVLMANMSLPIVAIRIQPGR